MTDQIDRKQNNDRIAMVEQCFGSSGQPLAVPDRMLIGEGVLTKICRKKPKPRQYFLFNDILVYGNIVITKKKYNKQNIIPLIGVQLISVEDSGSLCNGWQVISPSKSFTVYAATSAEKSQWMSHINKCVQLLHNKGGAIQTSMENSPVWVPDGGAKICMHCNKNEFTVINRKHHCRKCGAVVCGPCSSKKWLLPEQSSKPLRVCFTCYTKLANSTKISPEEKASFVKNSSDSSDTDVVDQSAAEPTFYGDNPNYPSTTTTTGPLEY